MAILMKDLIKRNPYHVMAVMLGNNAYWGEKDDTPYLYGEILTDLLNYDAETLSKAIDRVQDALERQDRQEVYEAYSELAEIFEDFPYSRLRWQDWQIGLVHLERGVVLYDDPSLSLLGEEKFWNIYFRARDDLKMIQERYTWFLERIEEKQFSEKKKGQKKLSPAEQVDYSGLSALVSGISLGKDPEVDPSKVDVQYMIYRHDDGTPEVVEKMYFERLADFVYVEFMRGLQKGYIPKKCGNCGKWFLQKPGVTYAYCDNIAPGETEKTCRDIGARKSFHSKVENNEIWKIHQRAYKKYYARIRKKTMTQAGFEEWAGEMERLRDDALRKYGRASGDEKLRVVEEFEKAVNAK